LLPLSRVVQPTQIENLDFITSGPEVDNPAELLASSNLVDFVAEVRTIYDIVVFDSSPLLAVTDPSILSAVVDGLLLVVRAEGTKRHDAERAMELLSTMESPVLGFLVNGIEKKNGAYGQGYGYSYGYGYGYGYGNGVQAGDAVNQISPPSQELTAANSPAKPTNGLPQGVRKD